MRGISSGATGRWTRQVAVDQSLSPALNARGMDVLGAYNL